jgi:hypothetical protein
MTILGTGEVKLIENGTMLGMISRQILTGTQERGRQARWYSNGSSVMRGKTAGEKTVAVGNRRGKCRN